MKHRLNFLLLTILPSITLMGFMMKLISKALSINNLFLKTYIKVVSLWEYHIFYSFSQQQGLCFSLCQTMEGRSIQRRILILYLWVHTFPYTMFKTHRNMGVKVTYRSNSTCIFQVVPYIPNKRLCHWYKSYLGSWQTLTVALSFAKFPIRITSSSSSSFEFL